MLVNEEVIIKELQSIAGLDDYLADLAYKMNQPTSERTENKESFENGVRSTYLHLRNIVRGG